MKVAADCTVMLSSFLPDMKLMKKENGGQLKKIFSEKLKGDSPPAREPCLQSSLVFSCFFFSSCLFPATRNSAKPRISSSRKSYAVKWACYAATVMQTIQCITQPANESCAQHRAYVRKPRSAEVLCCVSDASDSVDDNGKSV